MTDKFADRNLALETHGSAPFASLVLAASKTIEAARTYSHTGI